MERDLIIAWAAGIFEGEGCFVFNKDKAKLMSVTSTDFDVLLKLEQNFGGLIREQKKRNPKWKDCWVWNIRGKDAKSFYFCIKPYLLERRSKRGEYWFSRLPVKKINVNEEAILSMYSQGYTHKEIAKNVGLERSSVSKFLNRKNLRRMISKGVLVQQMAIA